MLCVYVYNSWLISYIRLIKLNKYIKIEDTTKHQKSGQFTIENQNIVRGYVGQFCFFADPQNQPY